MEIRTLTKQDKFEAGKISAFCFHERGIELEEIRKEWEKDESLDWGAFDDNGKLMGRIINNQFISYLDGREILNGGIGAVSTLPEYRNRGVIREIFQKLLPEAYQRGEVISTLYPFNHSFYRKFGYDTVCYRNQYKCRPEIFADYHFDGEVIMWQDGDTTKAYTDLYGKFAQKHNLAVKRSDKMMNNDHIKKQIFKNRKFSYLLRKDGKDLAYLLIEDRYEAEAAFMWVEEAVWNCREGFMAILGFLGRFSADYGTVELTLPYHMELYSIIRNKKAYDIEKTTRQDHMVRVVNAKKALEMIKKPSDTDFVISVEDDLILENSRTFHVTDQIVEETSMEADLVVGIQTFSQMIIGAISFEEALLKEDIKLFHKEELLQKVFIRKPIFINEHF